MDTELLKTFIEVTQTRNFARATHKMYFTPSAVRARIRQLEQVLCVTLLYRKRGNIQMTTEGELLLPRAQHIVEAWAQTRTDLARQAESGSHLSLGATPGLWRFVLNGVTARLRQALPGVIVRAEAYAQDDLLERLLANQLDGALVYDIPGDPALKSHRVGQLTLVLASSVPGLDMRTAQAVEYVGWTGGPPLRCFMPAGLAAGKAVFRPIRPAWRWITCRREMPAPIYQKVCWATPASVCTGSMARPHFHGLCIWPIGWRTSTPRVFSNCYRC